MRRSRRLLCSAVLTFLGCLPLSSIEIPIGGRVRDSGGVGLAGARVELRPILSSYEQGLRDLEGRAIEPAARAVTDADGRFEVLAPGEGMWEVGVFAEGYVPQRLRLTPLTGPETLFPVRLRRDAGPRVRIQGPDGRPLAGARVVGRTESGEAPGWQTIPRIATSGADGVVRLPASRDERLTLLAMAPGFPVQEGPEVRGPGEAAFRLAAGTPRRVEAPEGAILRDLQTSLVLGRGSSRIVTRGESWLLLETEDGIQRRFAVREGGAVRVEAPASRLLPGRVIDAAARQPVSGAWVWPRNDPGRFARTDAQGAYRMEIAGLRKAELEVAAAGLLPEVVDESIPWPEGGLPTVALDPEAFLEATVEDAEGQPAAGAEVAVLPRDESWFSFSLVSRAPRVGRVSAQGKVRIAGLRSGSPVEILIAGSGFAPAWLRGGLLKARENRLGVVLSRGGRVRGRIEDGQGRPVPEAQITIEPAPGTAGVWQLPDPAREAERVTSTAPDGGFAFADLPPGWYEPTVWRPGAAPQRLPRFEVKAGTAADLGALRMDDAEVLTARVVDSEGRPVAGAEIWADPLADRWEDRPASEEWPAAVSGADGGFSLRASRWQPLGLTVCGPGFVPLETSLPRFVPEEPLVLTLRRGAAVHGRHIGPDGLPAPGDMVAVDRVGRYEAPLFHWCEGEGWYAADEAGRFRITGLEPGLYWIGTRLELAAGESRELELPPGEAEGRSASLSGKLLGSDGLPIPGAVVRLSAYEEGGRFRLMEAESARTDADGSYRLAFRKPGLKIEDSSLGVSRHGRSMVLEGLSSWEGPPVVEADGRFDIRVGTHPLPLAPEAPVPFEDQRSGPEPLAAVAGRILGLEPEELAGVKVSAGLTDRHSLWTAGSVDARGSYRIEGLTRESWWIRAESGDRLLFETVHIPDGEDRIARDLVFPPVGEVTGAVETPGREPIPGAAVRLRHQAIRFQVRWPDVETRTGTDGRFEVRLPAGGYEVTASKEGFAPSPEVPADYVVVEEGKGDSAHIELHPAVELRGRLSGLPADEEDVQITAILVNAPPGYPRRLPGKVIGEGRYVVPGLGPGTWKVEARCDVFGAGRLEAVGEVVIPEEATGATLDLGFE